MVKKATAIISIFLAVCITFFTASIVPAYAEKTVEEKHQVNEQIGVTAYQKLNAYLADKNTEARPATLSDAESYTADLSTVYAGAYINDEGNLTVNITEISEKIQDELAQATDCAPIEYKLVEKNLSELQEAYEILSAHLTEAPYFEVVLSETKNIVEVYTEEDIEACTNYIESLVDLSRVEISSKANQISNCTKVYAGQGFVCPETNQVASVGFPCTRNSDGSKGFVTAAHTFINSTSESKTVKISNKTFGTVTASRYGVTTDAAFVEKKTSLLPPWWNLQSALPDGTLIQAWGTSSITPEGCTITKYGATTQFTEGKLISNSVSFMANDQVPFYSIAKATTRILGGDSGGPCMTPYNGKNTLVGIVKGYNKDTLDGYYCHLEYIMKELNITPDVP